MRTVLNLFGGLAIAIFVIAFAAPDWRTVMRDAQEARDLQPLRWLDGRDR